MKLGFCALCVLDQICELVDPFNFWVLLTFCEHIDDPFCWVCLYLCYMEELS